jgi:hypothetical protein
MSATTSQGLTIRFVFLITQLPSLERREAVDRAKKWAWYEALHAKDRDTRTLWKSVEDQLTGVIMAWALE